MFGTSGIRGPVGEQVTAQLAVDLGSALSAWGAERVVLGRDARPSGEYLADAVCSGLRQGGTDVIELGLASTPTIARSVEWRNASAGVAITASHNPPGYNGFKLWSPSGQAFRPSEQAEIEAELRDTATSALDWDHVGCMERWFDAEHRHAEAIVEAIDLSRPVRVVVDIGNGVGQVSARALDAAGCDVTTINGQPDGGFPGRPSEPSAENCGDLRRLVSASDADVGIAHDGDADRMRAVDATGRFLEGDTLLAIFCLETAAAGDRVVAPVDTSLAVEDVLAERGIELIRTRVGDVHVAEGIREHDAAFGGEPSGAWIWPEETLCPDGPLAGGKLVELIAEGAPLADRVESLEAYPIQRDAIETHDKPHVMGAVRDQIRARYEEVETIDGVRVETGDGWFLIRPSGTEPIIRITAEARAASRSEALLEDAREIVRSHTDA